MGSWHSYPSVFALGHSAIADLLTGPVYVEEKIDGSQFSFGAFDEIVPGEEAQGYQRVLRVRSKGCVMLPDAPEPMFAEAVETVKALGPELREGWTYRAEYLKKPKHNGLAYDRVPHRHLILFDINTDQERYLAQDEKRAEAGRLGLEVVPLLHVGIVADVAAFRAYLDTVSILGGQKVEGVVVKPVGYDKFGKDKKALLGKFVSEAFKETQAQAWKESNPHSKDIVSMLGDAYTTQARWMKAVQHLRERGELQDSPRDIAALMREVPEDIKADAEAEIKDRLFGWAWPQIRRMTVRGLPEWYKNELLKRQFGA